jgi:Kef-type K+ transport system membrane component KefB
VALTCAAIDDVTAWCLLALVVGIAQSRASDVVRPILLTVAFIAVVSDGGRTLGSADAAAD